MPIPDYNPSPGNANLGNTSYERQAKPLPSLPPLAIRASRLFYLLRIAAASALCALLFYALLPYGRANPGWWLLVVGVVIALLYSLYSARPLVGDLAFCAPYWQFTPLHGKSEYWQVPISALVWPWVVVIYRPGARSKPLVIYCDALSEAEFRQLKRWLLLCLQR